MRTRYRKYSSRGAKPAPDVSRAKLRDMSQAIRLRPYRFGALGAVGLFLLSFIFSSSVPHALAERGPLLALVLSPGNARALISLAQDARKIVKTATEEEQQARSDTPEGKDTDRSSNLAAGSQGAPGDAGAPSPQTEDSALQASREKIVNFASRALQHAPLNPEAYRLLGQAHTDADQARQFMKDALARSRREAIPALWLAHDAYTRGDWDAVIRMSEAAMGTRGSFRQLVMGYMNFLVTLPDGREKLAAALRHQPAWRVGFLNGLATQLAGSEAPLALFQKMKESGDTVLDQELGPFLDTLMRVTKSASPAYNIWLQLLPLDRLGGLRPINNLDFGSELGGVPFNWRVSPSRSVYINLERRPGTEARSLYLRFGVGQLRFGGVRQVIFLAPGSYRFEGWQKGRMSARRGMRWRIACYSGGRVVGESDQLMGGPRDGSRFSFDVVVPDAPACEAQIVTLLHDARSPSEQYASGDISFDRLKLEPVSK